jgi:hypothetical protein
MKVHNQNINIMTCDPGPSQENNNMANASVYVLTLNRHIMLMDWIQ